MTAPVQGRVHAVLERAPALRWLGLRDVAAEAGVSLPSARKYLAALEAAGQLETAGGGGTGRHRLVRLRRAETAADLDLLLAHFYDEVLGSPDRSHWRLPQLRAACDRLRAAREES